MKDNSDKMLNRAKKFRKQIKDMCFYVSRDIENTAERRYIERKYKNIINDYRERTRRIKNICHAEQEKVRKLL